METLEFNEAGSTSIYLNAPDKLDVIPASHVQLLTDEIKQQYGDPLAILRHALQGNPFPEMVRWLDALLEAADWHLEIAHAHPPMTGGAGFKFEADNVLGATISAAKPNIPADYPATLRNYYALVDQVDWMGCFCSGKLFGAGHQTPLSDMPESYHPSSLDASTTYVWGDSPSGEMLVWCNDDRSGWISHGPSRFHSLGTIADSIDWIFGKLNSEVCPEFPRNGA